MTTADRLSDLALAIAQHARTGEPLLEADMLAIVGMLDQEAQRLRWVDHKHKQAERRRAALRIAA